MIIVFRAFHVNIGIALVGFFLALIIYSKQTPHTPPVAGRSIEKILERKALPSAFLCLYEKKQKKQKKCLKKNLQTLCNLINSNCP